MMEYKEINQKFWGQHLWVGGYFMSSSGDVTDEVIIQYIENQHGDNFTLEDFLGDLVPNYKTTCFQQVVVEFT